MLPPSEKIAPSPEWRTVSSIFISGPWQVWISKQVAATLPAKCGIAVAACRTTLASADYSLCIAVGREMPRPRIVISRGGIWTARNAAPLKLRPHGAIQICLLLFYSR